MNMNQDSMVVINCAHGADSHALRIGSRISNLGELICQAYCSFVPIRMQPPSAR